MAVIRNRRRWPLLASSTEIRVRYEETDQAGVVYHANYLRYFEVGRTEMLRDAGLPYVELERRGILLTVTECALKYRAPAVYDDALRVETRVTELRRVRVRLDTRIIHRDSNRLLVEGLLWLASITLKGDVVPLPDDFRELLVRQI